MPNWIKRFCGKPRRETFEPGEAATHGGACAEFAGGGTGSRSSTVEGLSQGTGYDLVLEALSGGEVVAASPRVQFSTLVVPPVPGVRVDQVYPTSARANWSQLTATTVTDYCIVVYRRGTTDIVAQKTVEKGTGDRSTTIDGLPQGTVLELVIQAWNGAQLVSTSATQQFTTSRYVSATFGPSVTTAFTNVRQTKVNVNWSFAGDMEDIEIFQIVRSNGEVLGTTNPANYAGATTFTKEITRTANARYTVFIRAIYKDGTVVDSPVLQMMAN